MIRFKLGCLSLVLIAGTVMFSETIRADMCNGELSSNKIIYNEEYENTVDEISRLQLEAQISFFKSVLDGFGATEIMEVVELWAKSEETRNGVYQYAVACDDLKSDIIKKWGTPEKNFWIIGASSPWLKIYEIVHNEKIDNSIYEVTLKYYWATSAGDESPTVIKLTIIKDGKYWCVSKVSSGEL